MCVVMPSATEPLVALPLLHYVFDYRVNKIYRVRGSLELFFFRVIVIIQFRLTRNVIIFVRFVNLIVIVIDSTIQHRRAGMIELLYWIKVTIEDNAQLLCVIFKDNAQQPCVILQVNA
ncbi:hypothetical protein M9H77_25272 [Catharanthus roseus]|uniref:Uncharacterized protein n=1 Tax=Catharanthus roseus TaxID=4058 RepID=A0ACC0A799_CATRO|nr:hypothetical protein M9H77_25272 [Catharanthus roseus]